MGIKGQRYKIKSGMKLIRLECLSHLFGFKFSNGQWKKWEKAIIKFRFCKIKAEQLLRRTDPNKRHSSS